MNTDRETPALSVAELPTAPGRLPLLGHSPQLVRSPMKFLESLASIAPLVRVSLGHRPALVVTDPALVHDVLVRKGTSFEKGEQFENARVVLGNGILVAGRKDHLKHRRILQPAFQTGAIDSYGVLMHREATHSVAGWTPGETRNIQQDLDELSLRIAMTTLFSGNLPQAVASEVRTWLPVALKGVALRAVLPLRRWDGTRLATTTRFHRSGEHLRNAVEELVKAAEAGSSNADMMNRILDATAAQTEGHISQAQARDEALSVLVAAYETTASTLGSLLLEVSRNPRVEQRLLRELTENIDPSHPVRTSDLRRVPYTLAVVQEALRLHTPGWFLMRRAATDVVLGRTLIPKGTEVIFSPQALHHAPSVFPDPHSFNPDRWEDTPAKSLPPGSYLPFLEGRHQCIGNHYALHEMVTILIAVHLRWKLRVPASGPQPRHVFRTVMRLNGLHMAVTPRRTGNEGED